MSVSRSRVWFSLFVLAVFCVGLASGVLVGRRMAGALFVPPFRGPGFLAGGPRGVPPQLLLDRLGEELALTPGQRTQIEGVLRSRRERIDQFQRDTRARFEIEQRALRDEIRQLLTPEQQQKFDRWMDEAPRGGRRNRGFRPPGGGR